jgi:DNA polymerase I
MTVNRKKLLIIDSNALFHRSRSSLSRAMGEMTTSYGQPVTGTYGYLNTLFSLMEKEQFDAVVPVYDAGGNWRKKESDDYKANRGPVASEFKYDYSLLIETVLPSLGFTPVGVKGYEADDIIASIAQQATGHSDVFILTCDKDLLQCVTDKVKVILFNTAKKIDTLGVEEVKAKMGVLPQDIPLLKALAGDPSDNISGIGGVGPKTAIALIESVQIFDTVNSRATALCQTKKLEGKTEKFLSNLKLVLAGSDKEVSWHPNSRISTSEATAVFQTLEFKSYLKPARFNKIAKAICNE